MEIEVGVSEFQKKVLAAFGPLLAAARSFTEIGREMLNSPVSGQLPDLAKQITQTVGNSMGAVILLVVNGCGIDGLKIARTMFEAAVVLNYLDHHPELAQDFVDYRWVIQKKHHDYRCTLPSEKVPSLPAETVAEMESNYERVKARFMDRKGRVRNSWCKANLREMAREINAESIYGGLYPFGSSMTHTDILAVVAGVGVSGNVEPVPSRANITLASQSAIVSLAMALMAFDKIAGLGRGDELEAAFAGFKTATGAHE